MNCTRAPASMNVVELTIIMLIKFSGQHEARGDLEKGANVRWREAPHTANDESKKKKNNIYKIWDDSSCRECQMKITIFEFQLSVGRAARLRYLRSTHSVNKYKFILISNRRGIAMFDKRQRWWSHLPPAFHLHIITICVHSNIAF